MVEKSRIFVYWCALGLAPLILVGCVSSLRPSSESHTVEDSGPDADFDVSKLADAVPERVVVTNAGNKSPYTVLGKTYHINFDTDGFTESGYASWYGKKFHGNNTSNGEVYDMYSMTAAHKTLAIPTYVRVTNLENQRSVVVRVNDRGPFHDGRIIDLSYAAAKKLGYHHKGTAQVEIEVLKYAEKTAHPAGSGAPTGAAAGTYLQVGAFSRQQSALTLQGQLKDLTGRMVEVRTAPKDNLYKVLIGPIADQVELISLRQQLLDAKFAEPHVVEF